VLQRTQGCRKESLMVDVSVQKHWKRLSIKNGYRTMRVHGVSKPKSLFEAIKGVRVLTVGSIKRIKDE